MRRVKLAIIGSGPGGLSAALEAEELGLSPVLIDEKKSIGGQYLRSPFPKPEIKEANSGDW